MAQHRVWIYYYREAARGFGHLGLIVEQKNGSFMRYSQGAVNPKAWFLRILIFNQLAKVEVKRFPPCTDFNCIAPDATVVRIPTAFPDAIEHSIRRYITHNRPYHSFRNNCAGFIAQALNSAKDISLPNRLLPRNLYKEILLHTKRS